MAAEVRVAAVIVAAGRSSRMGRPKALLHLAGRPILDGLLEAYRGARIAPVVVVASGPTLEAAREHDDITAVEGDPDAEMVDSVARGIAAAGEGCDSVFVQPVDAPFTDPQMLAALLAGAPGTSRALCHQGRPGHPVLIARSAFAEIAEGRKGGLRAILADHDVEVVDWPDDRILADLDTPEDVERWRAHAARGLH